MEYNQEKILLNDIFHIPDAELKNYKIKLQTKIKSVNTDWQTAQDVYFYDFENYKKACGHNGDNKQLNRPYVITFARLERMDDLWIFTGIFNVLDYSSREYNNEGQVNRALLEESNDYKKYDGRLIVKFHKQEQHYVLTAEKYLDKLEVYRILDSFYDNECFKGYDKVDLSFHQLEHIFRTQNSSWKTAFENNKAIYLIRDEKTGKKYVGKADGKQMLWQRWGSYVKTGHGGNKEFKELSIDYIKNNFHYSILQNFVASVSDTVVDEQEKYWKDILQTRSPNGYNDN